MLAWHSQMITQREVGSVEFHWSHIFFAFCPLRNDSMKIKFKTIMHVIISRKQIRACIPSPLIPQSYYPTSQPGRPTANHDSSISLSFVRAHTFFRLGNMSKSIFDFQLKHLFILKPLTLDRDTMAAAGRKDL